MKHTESLTVTIKREDSAGGYAIVEKPNTVSSYDWPFRGLSRHTFSVPLASLRRYKHSVEVVAGTEFADLGERPEGDGDYWTPELIKAYAPKSLGNVRSDRDRDWE